MQKFNVGDMVIVDGRDCNDTQWPYYLTGSVGTVRTVGGDGIFYQLDLETVVDAQPASRARHSYTLEFLVENARFSNDSLELYEPQTEPDPAFDLVFE